jgi:hypothetical protein
MKAAEPIPDTFFSRAAIPAWDHPKSSTFAADSQASSGKLVAASTDGRGDVGQPRTQVPR